METKKCTSVWGHKYEPRYDYGLPNLRTSNGDFSSDEYVKMMEASKTKTYVHDICIHCGDIVGRE